MKTTVEQTSVIPTFTGGPWTSDAGEYEDGFSVYGKDGREVATGSYWAARRDSPSSADVERKTEELDANAHLIAAAPEMYAALQAFLASDEAAIELASSALAKARGQGGAE